MSFDIGIGELEVVNEVKLAQSSSLYDGAVTADGDLTIKVNAFYYDLGGVHGKYVGSCVNAVTNNATNYVYLNNAGNLAISVVSYPSTGIHIRLARVIAQSGIIVRVILERAFFTSGGNAPSQSIKSGKFIPGDFAGNPKKATATFVSAYPDTNYTITALALTDGTKTFSLDTESKTVNGFTVNLNSNNVANLIEVGWHAIAIGE